MKLAKVCLLVLAVCVMSVTAHAAIEDLADVGDVGYFRDTVTGRTWMDVDNFINMSYNDVNSEIAGSGFHIATYDELTTLQSSITPSTLAEYDSFNTIVGGFVTGSTRYTTEYPSGVAEKIMSGWYDDSDETQAYDDVNMAGTSWIYNWQLTWHTSSDNFAKDFQLYNTGAWVVDTAVAPEPLSSVLFLVGGAGLFARRFSKS